MRKILKGFEQKKKKQNANEKLILRKISRGENREKYLWQKEKGKKNKKETSNK